MQIINVNKPLGWTSFDVVRFFKKNLKEKKIGHLGTLDPLATGVLPIFIGKATKLISLLNRLQKTYLATLKLGERTDTFDAEGVILEKLEIAHLTEEQVCSVVLSYLGAQTQMTPIYSAIKSNGVPGYRLARQGHEVSRKSREIQINHIAVQKIDFPFVWITVTCSAGTYVRSLADDIGRDLNVGAHLAALQRIACGTQFKLEDTCDLENYVRGGQYNEESLEQLKTKIAHATVHPVTLLEHLETIHVDTERYQRLQHGQPLRLACSEILEPQVPSYLFKKFAKAIDFENHLIAVGQLTIADNGYLFCPSKIFV